LPGDGGDARVAMAIEALWLTPCAQAYLAQEAWPGGDVQRNLFMARVAAVAPERAVDAALAVVLLYGERRIVDRWQASCPAPVAMPNRRRPPPLVAAEEVMDIGSLLADLAQSLRCTPSGRHAADPPRPDWRIAASRRDDLLRWTPEALR